MEIDQYLAQRKRGRCSLYGDRCEVELPTVFILEGLPVNGSLFCLRITNNPTLGY